MLIWARMLMRCLRKSGFDRRHIAETALAMRDVMSPEEEPSFVITDPKICEGIDKQYFLVAYLQWQMVGGAGGESNEFCLRPADLHPHKVGFFLYNQSFFEHARRRSKDGDVIRVA